MARALLGTPSAARSRSPGSRGSSTPPAYNIAGVAGASKKNRTSRAASHDARQFSSRDSGSIRHMSALQGRAMSFSVSLGEALRLQLCVYTYMLYNNIGKARLGGTLARLIDCARLPGFLRRGLRRQDLRNLLGTYEKVRPNRITVKEM